MRYFDQIGIDQIAVETGLAEGTIYNTIHTALKMLSDVFVLSLIASGSWLLNR